MTADWASAGLIGATSICGSASDTHQRRLHRLAASRPGMIRQFTVAFAVCGSAFSACPPCSIVATQVVRSSALWNADLADSRAPPPHPACARATAFMSAPLAPESGAILSK